MPLDSRWHHYLVEFADPPTAEHTAATLLAPALDQAQQDGELDRWWHLRKTPAWRLRYQPVAPDTAVVDSLLAELETDGQVARWTRGIYEPETIAFGGTAGMDIAHTLFHHDSRHCLARTTAPAALGQRETTVLLFSAMLRAAGLDWFEQGDVWAKIAALRPAAHGHHTDSQRTERWNQAVRRLMTTNTHRISDVAPDQVPETWWEAFDTAGRQLATLAREGQLDRGLRAVLVHHFIFHANRAGLSGPDQATLATLAVDAVFHSTPTRQAPAGTTSNTVRVPAMTTTVSDASTDSADELRAQLTDRLIKDGTIRTDAVEAAFRQVPRHLFLPGLPLTEAYADEPVYTKHEGDGTRISAASQPKIVAMMLEQLGIQPGERLLELGAATGYNAALMTTLTGPTGHVTTIDIDEDLVAGAREHLAAASISNVEAVAADGALGHPEAAPFDRVIATVGAHEVPAAWLDQLAPGGRLVAPVRLRGCASRSIIFERDQDGWSSLGSEMAIFMPLRGLGDDARRVLDLTSTGDVTLQTHKDNNHATNPDTLAGVFDTPAREVWTGVHFVPMESFEWLDLWLACHLPNPLMRMEVTPAAKDSGLVRPMFPTVAMATTAADGSLAYLTIRIAEPGPDGGRRFEVGVIGHGASGQELAEQVASEITAWDKGFRSSTVRFTIPDAAPQPDTNPGRVVLDRPTKPMTVTWE
ncbi:protein-L-isoaspartate(D-aspartate) O-methyltransferase [Saccharopolyspora antimicrobica]|uniref:Protein-L-isoaspartate O-methyltransferase n=1 Tax=Saccharopolyspora antimicrobica TaxID=455193 RepID=A0A1I5ATW8_9PSEU|nr:methyltransferase, FxLD system [Saccharopolyspora antimicrobica]RKT86367.1 protein-L-isoaspartate(D-aspartate) O-methyltransferase [Saccharopolyspora antimicrobica]SFN65976.1 protein-L-isoaspartate(D-aspartate) O-methyltransferase [Saccharopolyspora antimicrobica]